MGRYSTELAGPAPGPAQGGCGIPQHQPFGIPQQSGIDMINSTTWPSTFDKPVVALDLNGVIIQDTIIKGPDSIKVIPGVLEAIRMIRLKGYKLLILSDQPTIYKGLNTTQDIDSGFNALMKIFGEAGIMSIDGFLYNTSDMKEDDFAKPNLGMVKRAEAELLRGSKIKDGWYIGDSLVDLKFADKIGAVPVLVKTGNSQHAIEQLDKFTYKDLKQKAVIVNSLLDFANSLK